MLKNIVFVLLLAFMVPNVAEAQKKKGPHRPAPRYQPRQQLLLAREMQALNRRYQVQLIRQVYAEQLYLQWRAFWRMLRGEF